MADAGGKGTELPVIVVSQDFSLRMGQRSPYNDPPMSGNTSGGYSMTESAVWTINNVSGGLEAQYIDNLGHVSVMGPCYKWTNDASELNHFAMVPATYEGAHLCGQDYYGMTLSTVTV